MAYNELTAWVLIAFCAAAFCQAGLSAEADSALPFDVTLGGAKARLARPDATFARVASPVPADASVTVGIPFDDTTTIVISVYKANAEGKVLPDSPPASIVLSGTNRGSLSDTVNGKPLAGGWYRMNVVAGGRIAVVAFRIG